MGEGGHWAGPCPELPLPACREWRGLVGGKSTGLVARQPGWTSALTLNDHMTSSKSLMSLSSACSSVKYCASWSSVPSRRGESPASESMVGFCVVPSSWGLGLRAWLLGFASWRPALHTSHTVHSPASVCR